MFSTGSMKSDGSVLSPHTSTNTTTAAEPKKRISLVFHQTISSAWSAARAGAAKCLSLHPFWVEQSYDRVRSHTMYCTFTNNDWLTEWNAQDKSCFYYLGKIKWPQKPFYQMSTLNSGKATIYVFKASLEAKIKPGRKCPSTALWLSVGRRAQSLRRGRRRRTWGHIHNSAPLWTQPRVLSPMLYSQSENTLSERRT